MRNASQDTFNSIDDNDKQPEDGILNDFDAEMDDEEIGNEYDRQSN